MPLVGVVLDADEIEPGFVGGADQLARATEALGRRHDRDAELQGRLSASGCHRHEPTPLGAGYAALRDGERSSRTTS